ncbi:MAG TPA: DUF502 domain-containing protein [Longimicrobiales bacterium]|nr:DUF502 domain-containing protein [Longimicrobiales bacterium]
MSASPRRPLRALRRYLLEGLAVIGPIGVTVFVLSWLFQRLDGVLGEGLSRVLERRVPGLGIAVLVVLVVVVGWLTERALGARMVAAWDRALRHVPVARRIYGGASRILGSLVGEERLAFHEVVLFEYPTPGLWSVGFVTGSAADATEEILGEAGVTVYMPTAPNPMSGYLIQLPRSKVRRLESTVEEAFTYVLSAGAVSLDRAGTVLAAGTRGAPGRSVRSRPG